MCLTSLLNLCLLLLAQLEALPSRGEVEPWLGRYVAGPEHIAFRWQEGLVFELGKIVIPANGEWHETVPEFIVRHRVSWDREGERFILEERHDEGAPWRYELKLSTEGDQLLKFALREDGSRGDLIRRYERQLKGDD